MKRVVVTGLIVFFATQAKEFSGKSLNETSAARISPSGVVVNVANGPSEKNFPRKQQRNFDFEACAKEIKDLFVEKLGLDTAKITNDTQLLEDLKADSLDIVELVMMLEDMYNIEISENEAKIWRTVRDVIDCCVSKIKSR